MEIKILKAEESDLPKLVNIWNEVVESGVAFPQTEKLDIESGKEFFKKQDFVGVAKYNEEVAGLYILHPNNVGRCSHQSNASYAVSSKMRNLKIGEHLVKHSLKKANELGYKLLIFNAVVKDNESAIHLYNKLGFVKIGEVPGGFLAKDGTFHDTIMFYHKTDC